MENPIIPPDPYEGWQRSRSPPIWLVWSCLTALCVVTYGVMFGIIWWLWPG